MPWPTSPSHDNLLWLSEVGTLAAMLLAAPLAARYAEKEREQLVAIRMSSRHTLPPPPTSPPHSLSATDTEDDAPAAVAPGRLSGKLDHELELV